VLHIADHRLPVKHPVFDLDPAPSLPFERVVDVARRARDVLEEYGVPLGVKKRGTAPEDSRMKTFCISKLTGVRGIA
jgi:DNA primase